MLPGDLQAPFGICRGKRHVSQNLRRRRREIQRESQRKRIVETVCRRKSFINHCTRGVLVAGQGERHRAEISRAAGSIMIAIAGGCSVMNCRVEKPETVFGMPTGAGELTAYKCGRPGCMMGL